MAHPSTGTPAGIQRLTGLVATIAVAVAVALAFGRAFEGRATTGKLLAMGVATAVLAWAFERRSLLLATLAAVALLIVGLGLLVFPTDTWFGLPTLQTGREMLSAAGAVGEQARLQVAPTPPVTPLVFAAVTAVWAAVFSCHALAFRAGSPMLGLVPPAALVVFADSVLEELVRPVYGVLFLVAALAVLFADSVRRVQGWGPVWSGPSRRDRLAPSAGRNARRIAGAAIAVAVAAPFIIPGFGGRSVIDLSSINADDSVTVSVLVSMASELNRDEPVDVFVVHSEADTYWRLTSLEHFDGVQWQVGEQAVAPVGSGTELAGALDDGTSYQQTFTMANDLNYPYAPAGFQPSSISIDTDASWDSRSQTLITEPLSAGDTYTVTSTYVTPTASDLEGVDTVSAVGTELTALPDDIPPQIAEIAHDVLKKAGVQNGSDYDKVFAIQNYLRSTEFLYDTTVPSLREDSTSILEFLTVTHAGFCQQFATAMATLLRSLGIPARVAVGFTRGDPVAGAADTYKVTTDELHSWVEVPFEGYGWLSFEPTKTRANGTAPYSRPVSEPTECPGPRVDCTPQTGAGEDLPGATRPTPGIELDTTDPFTGFASGTSSTMRWVGVGAAALIGLVLIGLIALVVSRRVRRRRALARAASEPRAAIVAVYRDFTKRTRSLGHPRGPGETPAEYATRLREVVEEADRLDRLTVATIGAAYGRTEPSPDDALDATADADEIARSMRRELPLRRRVRSTLDF